MQAAIYTKYGPPEVLKLKEVDKPSPGNNELLIKVIASSVTPMDYKCRSGKLLLLRLIMTGLIKPKMKILGVEFSGEIEAIDKETTYFSIGDKVFGRAKKGGAHAEYICVAEKEIALNPSDMGFEEAGGLTFGATTALGFLRDGGNIQAGQKVLINGASGGVGTFAVQLAKYYKTEVTAVCSTPNLEWVKELGADSMIDYTREDFTQIGESYDIIFDCVGKRTYNECKNSLTRDGIYLSTVMTFSLFLQMIRSSKSKGKKAKFMLPDFTSNDLTFLINLIEEEKLKTVIDRTYPLSKIAEAHAYAEKGHAKGKVIISIKS